MSSTANTVNVVLGMNSVQFTQGVKQAQAELDKFAGKSKTAGHTTVSSMQASSAAIRALHGGFESNIRAVERFITTIPGAGKALQMLFPLVGGVAFGAMIVDAGAKVVAFIDKANKMPAAIKQGFDSLHLSAQSSNDALKLTDDLLQNHIDKLQGKPQNNLAIQLDEARIKADDLAKSLENDATKVKSLLEANKLSTLAGLLTGKAGTSSVAGTVNFGMQEIQRLAYLNRQAVGTPGASQAQQNLTDKRTYYQKWAKNQLFIRDNPQYSTDATQDMAGDQGANRNILLGFQDILGDQQISQAEKNRNAKLVPQDKAAEASKEAATKAAEARRKAAEEMGKGWAADIEAWKVAQEYSRNISNYTSQYMNEMAKSNGLSSDDSKNLGQQGHSANDYVQSLRQSIDLNKQNSSAIAESSIAMAIATGQMTRMSAAQALANLHTQDYEQALQQLKDQRDSITSSKEYDQNPLGRQAALQDNTNRTNALTVNRGIQIAQDNQTVSPASSSASTGFDDAINDFVNASKDAAGQMRDITDNTLNGLNQQIVAAISGQRTHFGNYGAGVFRNVAGIGLQKAEGSALSLFGGGSLGSSATNAMWVRSADGAASSVASGVGGFFNKLFGGKKSGGPSSVSVSDDSGGDGGGMLQSLSGLAMTALPMLASGGYLDGPAIIGEQGPELWLPSGTGNVIPNHQLVSSGSTGHTINIDASGSTDPAQTRVQVMRGIQAAAPHISANTINAQQDQKRRKPTSAR